MLLGDLIATLDDEYVAEEVLMELDDLALVRRTSEAARGCSRPGFLRVDRRASLPQPGAARRVDVLDERDGTL